MLKRETFERVGAFNEDYFMYSEDIDLCYKVQRAGYKNYYVPEAEVIHFGGNSSKQAPSNFFQRDDAGIDHAIPSKHQGRPLRDGLSACHVSVRRLSSWAFKHLLVDSLVTRSTAASPRFFAEVVGDLRWSVKRADSLNSYLAVGRAFDAEDGGKTWNSNCLGEA